MKITIHVITVVCVRAGQFSRVGERKHVSEEVKGNVKPVYHLTERFDSSFGLWREVMRTELQINAPELDGDELRELQIESLQAERSELEANFYVAKRRIDDRIKSLQAIEYQGAL